MKRAEVISRARQAYGPVWDAYSCSTELYSEGVVAVAKALGVHVEPDELPKQLVLESPVTGLAGMPHNPICEWAPGLNRRLGLWLRAENEEAQRVADALIYRYNDARRVRG